MWIVDSAMWIVDSTFSRSKSSQVKLNIASEVWFHWMMDDGFHNVDCGFHILQIKVKARMKLHIRGERIMFPRSVANMILFFIWIVNCKLCFQDWLQIWFSFSHWPDFLLRPNINVNIILPLLSKNKYNWQLLKVKIKFKRCDKGSRPLRISYEAMDIFRTGGLNPIP